MPMSLIPWRPFSDLDSFLGDEDWFLPLVPRSDISKPAMDVYEKDGAVIAELAVPGVEPEKLSVSVEDGTLRVSGETEEKKEAKEKGYWRKEIRKGSFERVVRLPVAVKEEAVEANYEKGVLTVRMPKVEPKPPAKVKVKVVGKE